MTQNSRGRSFVPTRVAGRVVAAGLSAGLVASAVAFAGPALAAGTDGNVLTARIAGADRYGTANAIADAHFPTGAAPAVVIARGDVGVDALSASALAGALGAPIVLTTPGSLPASVIVELSKLKNGSTTAPTKAYIIGSDLAVSSDVESVVKSIFGNVTRVAGADRYGTAAAVADQVKTIKGAYGTLNGKQTVFLTRGDVLADALSVGPAAAKAGIPVLLTGTDSLPSSTLSRLSSGLNVVIVGSTLAVSSGVEAQVKAAVGSSGSVTRVYGTDRYDTGRQVAETIEVPATTGLGFGTDNLVLARGDGSSFADALSAGPLAASASEPILLVSGLNSIPDATVKYHTDHADSITKITAVGSDFGAISNSALGAAAKAAGDVKAPLFDLATPASGSTNPTTTVVAAEGTLGSNHTAVDFKENGNVAGDAGVLGNGLTVTIAKGVPTGTSPASATLSSDGRTVSVVVAYDSTSGDVTATTLDVQKAVNALEAPATANSPIHATALDGSGTSATIAPLGTVTLSGGSTTVTFVGSFDDALLGTTPGVSNFGLDTDSSNLVIEVPSATKVTTDTTGMVYTVAFSLSAAQVKAEASSPRIYVSGVSDLAGNVKNTYGQ